MDTNQIIDAINDAYGSVAAEGTPPDPEIRDRMIATAKADEDIDFDALISEITARYKR